MLPRDAMKQVRRLQFKARRAVEELLGGEYHSVFKGAGIAFDEVLPNRLRSLKAVERSREVALSPQHEANIVIRVGEVVLPAGIAGVAADEALPDRLCSLIAVERGREVTLSP